MIPRNRIFIMFLLVWTILPASAFAQFAVMFLVNGKVLTVGSNISTRQAMAIQGERILSVGGNAQIGRLVNSDTKVIDLKGKTLIPGLIDNHVHFIRHAFRRDHEARIDGVTSRMRALSEPETVSGDEALIVHTRSNAYLFFQENELGFIEKVKLADMVVLGSAYMAIPEEQLEDFKPLLTMAEGRVAFRSGI